MSILTDADKIINGDRAADYGDITNNFQNIGNLWRAWVYARHGVDVPFDAWDCEQMMIQVKQARLANTPTHRDSRMDIAGYAGCGDKIEYEEDTNG